MTQDIEPGYEEIPEPQEDLRELGEEELDGVSGGNTYYWQKDSKGVRLFYVDKNKKDKNWILYGPDKKVGEGKTIAKPIKKGSGSGWRQSGDW